MALFFVSRVVAALVALVTLLIFTRLLTPDEFGRYSIVILSAVIAQQLVFAWIVVAITRFHSAPEFDGQVIALGLGAALWTLGLVAPIALLGCLVFSGDLRETCLLATVFAVAHATHELALACLRVERRSQSFAAIAVGRPVLGASLAAVVLLGGGNYQSAVLALAAGALVTGGYGLASVVRRSGIRRPSGFALSACLIYGQPLAFVMSGAMIFALATQLTLALLTNLGQVGFFSAAGNLTERSIAMLMMTLGQTTAASIFRAQEEETPYGLARQLEEHFGFLLLVSIPLVVVFVFANQTVSRVLFGAEFGSGVSPYLPLLAVAAFLNGLQSAFFAFIFSVRKQTLLQLGLTVVLLLVHVAIVLTAVGLFGGIGAGYAAVASGSIAVALYAWYGREVFDRCTLRPCVIQMGIAATAALPFVAAADRASNLVVAIALIAAGVLVLLAILKLLRYSSLEAILGPALRTRT